MYNSSRTQVVRKEPSLVPLTWTTAKGFLPASQPQWPMRAPQHGYTTEYTRRRADTWSRRTHPSCSKFRPLLSRQWWHPTPALDLILDLTVGKHCRSPSLWTEQEIWNREVVAHWSTNCANYRLRKESLTLLRSNRGYLDIVGDACPRTSISCASPARQEHWRKLIAWFRWETVWFLRLPGILLP